MHSRRALVVLIAVLALADLAGLLALREAWNDRHADTARASPSAAHAVPASPGTTPARPDARIGT